MILETFSADVLPKLMPPQPEESVQTGQIFTKELPVAGIDLGSLTFQAAWLPTELPRPVATKYSLQGANVFTCLPKKTFAQ